MIDKVRTFIRIIRARQDDFFTVIFSDIKILCSFFYPDVTFRQSPAFLIIQAPEERIRSVDWNINSKQITGFAGRGLLEKMR
ncbi:MAG: hypothetical protein K6E50_07195 [Lachnospiraceae bacterium]|nr:hypothetical protein [Lachnospiraceae bacterium]